MNSLSRDEYHDLTKAHNELLNAAAYEGVKTIADSGVEAVFAGAGIGAISAAIWSIPTGAGALFGAAYSLSRVISVVVMGALGGCFFGEEYSNTAGAFVHGGMAVTQGLIAFGTTALFLSGFTAQSALALTAIMATVDIVSLFTLRHTWTSVF